LTPVVAALVSPLGLALVAGAALSAWAGSATGVFGRVRDAIADLGAAVRPVLGEIMAALEAGNVQAAAMVLMSGLGVIVERGRAAILNVWTRASTGFVSLWIQAIGGIRVAFLNFFAWLSERAGSVVSSVSGVLSGVLAAAGFGAAGTAVRVAGAAAGSTGQGFAAIGPAGPPLAAGPADTAAGVRLAGLAADGQIAAGAARVAAAQRELEGAMRYSAELRDQSKGELENALRDAEEAAPAPAGGRGSSGVLSTFSGVAAAQLFGGGNRAADRTARATEETARNTERIARSRVVFT
jgi:hypothetical protein